MKRKQPDRNRQRRRQQARFAPQPTGCQIHPRVQQFLDTVGFTPRRFVDDFERFLLKNHGDAGAVFLDLSHGRASAGHDDGDYADLIQQLYRAKNANWELSRDVTSQHAGRQYSNYLTLFTLAREPPTANRIVDIGCDNGIATCFYAWQFPEAEVIGIDRCAEGIACAEHLAQVLKLPNIRFIHDDAFVSRLDLQYADACDLVTMTLSGYEALENPLLTTATLVSFLHRLVSPTGTLIAMEPGLTDLLHEIDAQFAEQLLVDLFFEDGGGNEIAAKVMFAHKHQLNRALALPVS